MWMLGARVLLIALVLGSAVVATPAQAACDLPPIHLEAKGESGSRVEFSYPGNVVTWITPDGRRLNGAPATVRRTSTQATATFKSAALTIVVRADLRRGRVQGSAVERLPGYGVEPARDPRRPKPVRVGPDPNRQGYTLSARNGPRQAGTCLSGPGKTPHYVPDQK